MHDLHFIMLMGYWLVKNVLNIIEMLSEHLRDLEELLSGRR
ncbi:MAG: hypothetical protein QW826_07005 [Candidatus Nezhaarchaeales archaeon]